MKILITGGSGFIGTNFITMLIGHNHQIINLDKNPPRNPHQIGLWRQCDILNKDKMFEIITEFNPEFVIHLAAKTGVYEKTVEEFKDNTIGTLNLIEVLSEIKCLKRVIFTSSLLVCKMGYMPQHDTDYNPSTPYGSSKVEMEKIIRHMMLDFEWIIIRPISIWGPWFREPYLNFFKSIAQGWYFHIGHGKYKRSLGYVENINYQIYKLLTAESYIVNRKTYYVADEKPLDLYILANEIASQLKKKPIKHIPYVFIKIIAYVGDFFLLLNIKSFPMSTFRLNNILTEYVYDLTPTVKIAGSSPFDYKTAVTRTLDWMRLNGKL